ncbi:class I SAM-dependent methyltransferase [Nannocystis sp.]|uniref:class I SAM-dependent methyltransferase n=1 Tax=Nannocystis sp. TaxID=1962667 RepID=UPI002426EE81|nr:class I SAM-dependent methyltransferase [Nannocystis sp.]MBK7826571.1 class I SAM-dependent methyltransferase [Nannocystis sp.]MBK9754194.1 class I SAM-dependent methyltransferase [Nannocystis sp.]
MSSRDHWEKVYATKAPDGVSWYAPHLARSLALIEATGVGPDDAIIDVGGGASTLVDDLLDRGHRRVTVLDLSQHAIDVARERLGDRAARVDWRVADVTRADLPDATYAVWHDRAVFHFLTDPEQRARYVAQVRRSVLPGGHVIVATFGPEGPEKCSGLDVVRYSDDTLHAEFGPAFVKVGSATERHVTPWGSAQEFVYCYCRVTD